MKKHFKLKKFLKVTKKMLLTDGITQTDQQTQEMISEILKPLDNFMSQTKQNSFPEGRSHFQKKNAFTVDELISIYAPLSEARTEAPIFEEINDESLGALPSSFYTSLVNEDP